MLPWVLSPLVLLLALGEAAYGRSCEAAPLRVAVDVGHSRSSFGATSATGRREHDFNERFAQELLDLAKRVRTLSLFRFDDPGARLGLRDRPFIAANRNAEVFLSIHHDSVNIKYMDYWYHEGRKLQFSDVFRGFSLFIFGGPMHFEQSFKLATEIGATLTSRGLKPTLHHAEPIPGESRPLINKELGIYTAPFAVLRYATVPAVLFEVGVIANREEEHDLEDQAYRSKAEDAILRSLEEYCRMEVTSSAGGARVALAMRQAEFEAITRAVTDTRIGTPG